MSILNFWDQYELYYEHEFINVHSFPKEKQELLKSDMGSYFINNDFTIYQEKNEPLDKINEDDFIDNKITFMRILYHLPFHIVEDFIEFHFEKFKGNKEDFLNHTYHEFKGSTLKQGDKILPPKQQKLILLNWCENKLLKFQPDKFVKIKDLSSSFIDPKRIEELGQIQIDEFDFKKLICLANELNKNYQLQNYLSVAILGRAIIDHIPPLFGFDKFNMVANNYGGQSFKKTMSHLNISMRSIADNFLHEIIRKKESLPTENQINFSRELDVLLAEIIRSN